MLRVICADKRKLIVTDSLQLAMNAIGKDIEQLEGPTTGISLDWTGISLVVYAHGRIKTHIYRIEDIASE